ncbi:uncharacterized protein LOC109837443 isoform X3 [Asparagus officinalis]|uniref:uncharacterized protein LOC109837443 isoform X3 n=1 Tax=Asparagus officinalis TaxID=4686 RepID=UPI00098E051B|nr:uncharacterized protein LOC109837443 isoform X3 [Asparagus officinalis]
MSQIMSFAGRIQISGLECHGDNISSVSGIKDSNIGAGYCNMESAQKNAACPSVSVHGLLSREIEDTGHYEATGYLRGGENEDGLSNCGRRITSPEESLQKCAYSADASFSRKSNFTEEISRHSSPKVQSPCSASQDDYVSCHNADYKDVDGGASGQLHIDVKSLLGKVEVASSLNVPSFNHENSKSGYAGNTFSADTLKITGLENENGLVKISSDEVMKSSSKGEEIEMPSILVEVSNVQEPQQVMSSGDSESEAELTDVKVCDICGDAGREELLAFCSKCSDGAEHTYCMRVMLRKLPEGNWSCEECQMKEDAEKQKVDRPYKVSGTAKESDLKENGEVKKEDEKVFATAKKLKLKEYAEIRKGDKSEVVQGITKECKKDSENKKVYTSEVAFRTSKLTCLTETSQKLANSSNLKPKLDMEDVDRDIRRLRRGLQSPRISAKRHSESQEVISLNSKSPQKTIECFGMGSPRKNSALSRENSFKNMEGVIEKVATLPALNRGQAASGSIYFSRSQSMVSSNSSKVPARREPHHGVLSRSSSFGNLNSKKPKVKQLTDSIPVKPKISRGPSLNNTRKEALARSMTKSASFKNMSSGHYNTEPACKTQFIHQTRVEDPKSLKQLKERKIIKKKRSSVLDRSPTDLSPRIHTSVLSKMGMNTPRHDLKVNDMSESNILRMKQGSDDANALGGNEANLLSKCSSTILGTACLNAKVNEDQRPCSLPKEDAFGSSNSSDKLCDNADIVEPQGALHTTDSVHQDDKPKDLSIFGSSRHSVSDGSQNLHCQKCNETGHATQFCSTEKPPSSASKPPIEKNSKVGNNTLPTISRSRLQKIHRKGAELEDSPISIANQSCEVASKDFHASSPDQPRNSTPLAGTSDAEEVLKSSVFDPLKTTHIADVSPPVETSCTSGACQTIDSSCPLEGNVSNATDTVSDELHIKRLLHHLPDQASVLANPFRTLAIPELESIWKGSLEVLKNVNEAASFDGFQAHLSTSASAKVLQVATKIPCKVQLEEVSYISSWPLQSVGVSPTEHNIALFFFAKDMDSYERSYSKLLEKMLKNDLALRGILDGVELLIFPSTKLPLYSQRWNRLFFLWGMFKRRRKISLTSKLSPQKRPSRSVLNMDPATQYLPCALSSLVSDSEKVVSVESPEKSTNCGISPKAEALRSTTFVERDRMWRDQESPHLHNSSFQRAAYNRPASKKKLNSSSASYALTSTDQLADPLSNHPKSRFKATDTSSKVGNDENYERNFGYDFEDKHVASLSAKCPITHAPATNEQIGLSSASPLSFTLFDCRKGTDKASSGSERVSGEEEVLTKNVAVVCDELQGNLTGIGHVSFGERPHRKRAYSSTTNSLSQAPGYITSNDETTLSKHEVTYLPINFPLDDEREQKRICYSKGHGGSSLREEILSMRSLSKVHPLLPSLNDQPTESTYEDVSKVTPGNLRKAEKFFFPAESSPVQNTKPDNLIRILSSDDEDYKASNIPNLELALGSKWKAREQQPNEAVEDDDDISASLSLSLAMPSPKESLKSILRPEQHLHERSDVSTAMLLFTAL